MGFRILNGRIAPSNSSAFSCFTRNGNSVVDYVLLKDWNLHLIRSFHIGSSDHAQLEMVVFGGSDSSPVNTKQSNLNNHDVPGSSCINRLIKGYDKRFISDSLPLDNLKTALCSDNISKFLHRIQKEIEEENIPVEDMVKLPGTELVNISINCFRCVNPFGSGHRGYNKAK